MTRRDPWLTWAKLGGISLACATFLALVAVITAVDFIWVGVIVCILLGLGFLARQLRDEALLPQVYLLGHGWEGNRWQMRFAVLVLMAGFFGPLIKPSLEIVQAVLARASVAHPVPGPPKIYNITNVCPYRDRQPGFRQRIPR